MLPVSTERGEGTMGKNERGVVVAGAVLRKGDQK